MHARGMRDGRVGIVEVPAGIFPGRLGWSRDGGANQEEGEDRELHGAQSHKSYLFRPRVQRKQ